MRKSLDVGATGLVVGEICRQLRENDVPVRALVRKTSSPEKVDHLRGMGVETVIGDLEQRRVLGLPA